MAAVRQGSRPRVRQSDHKRHAFAGPEQWAFCRGDLGGGYYRRTIAPAMRLPEATPSGTADEEAQR